MKQKIRILMLVAASAVCTFGTHEADVNKEFLDELEESSDKSTVEELVDLICQWQIKDACGSVVDPINPLSSPKDCYDIFKRGHTESGQYDIYPIGVVGAVRVYCDMTTDGGGWTVFQRRRDATTDFFREWEDYKVGFGSAGLNFWLGNENLFHITSQDDYKLRVDLEDFDGETRYATYDHFAVGDEASNYVLAVDGYDGDAGDGLANHNNQQFSTKDRENDIDAGRNCAVTYRGGWWYEKCLTSNLNGLYLEGADSTYTGVQWKLWRAAYSLKRTVMMIKPSDA